MENILAWQTVVLMIALTTSVIAIIDLVGRVTETIANAFNKKLWKFNFTATTFWALMSIVLWSIFYYLTHI